MYLFFFINNLDNSGFEGALIQGSRSKIRVSDATFSHNYAHKTAIAIARTYSDYTFTACMFQLNYANEDAVF